jgi:hypothetical protein
MALDQDYILDAAELTLLQSPAVWTEVFVGPHRHWILAENILAINTHYPAMNLALTHSCLQKCNYHTDLNLE